MWRSHAACAYRTATARSRSRAVALVGVVAGAVAVVDTLDGVIPGEVAVGDVAVVLGGETPVCVVVVLAQAACRAVVRQRALCVLRVDGTWHNVCV
jgi:hypothetical protein